MTSAKISIIIPVYNVAQYLPLCLASAIRQTLPDIEIICINDGSTDNSLSILNAFAEADPRISIISKENGGLSSARNTGLDVANGELFMFLDSDDYIEETSCEIIWQQYTEHPFDILAFGMDTFPVWPGSPSWYEEALTIPNNMFYDQFTPYVLFRQKGSNPCVCRQAYRHAFLLEHALCFDERVRFGEDMVFQMEAFPHGKTFAYINDTLYHYRWSREGSLMNLHNDPAAKFAQHLSFSRIITEYWNRHGWLADYKEDYVQWLLHLLIPDPLAVTTESAEQICRLLKDYELVGEVANLPRSMWEIKKALKGTIR